MGTERRKSKARCNCSLNNEGTVGPNGKSAVKTVKKYVEWFKFILTFKGIRLGINKLNIHITY